MGLFSKLGLDKLKNGLLKTKQNFIDKINEVLKLSPRLDDSVIEQLEDILLLSDVGVNTTNILLKNAKDRYNKGNYTSTSQFLDCLKTELKNVVDIENPEKFLNKIRNKTSPYIILIAGVNGVGKTTTIGKLANLFKEQGLSVIIGAADTFRAAANEQLEIWAKRADVEIVKSSQGADPGSVVFQTVQKAIEKKFNVVLIDTAGRLHVKSDLMQELGKIQKIIEKKTGALPDDVLMIIDANIGQNALQQVKEFSKIINITGLIITKLDGTAKGGVVFQLCNENKLPIRFIGLGEGIDDIQLFDADSFVNALFDNDLKN